MSSIVVPIIFLAVAGLVCGLALSVCAKFFAVKEDPRIGKVASALPGANCGGCGYAGCAAYAAAVVKDGAPTNRCIPGGSTSAKKIAEIMGVSAESSEKMTAFVPCSGCEGAAEPRFSYNGPQDCRSAMLFGGKSNKLCTFACIGMGNCVKACQFDAMHIVNGVAKVDRSACVGCGACADACPKSIISLIPASQKVMPTCSNKDKGAKVMKMCSVGCIGCMKCQRECPAQAIVVKDALAIIDTAKCTQCGHCAEICPRHIINVLD